MHPSLRYDHRQLNLFKDTSKNRHSPQLRRQPRAQILMYSPIHGGFARVASLHSLKNPGF